MQAIARRAAAPVFALALFSSAALIFVLQPLFGAHGDAALGRLPAGLEHVDGVLPGRAAASAISTRTCCSA